MKLRFRNKYYVTMSLRYTILCRNSRWNSKVVAYNKRQFSLLRKRQDLVCYYIYYMSVTSSGREVEHREVVTVVRGESLFSGWHDSPPPPPPQQNLPRLRSETCFEFKSPSLVQPRQKCVDWTAGEDYTIILSILYQLPTITHKTQDITW